MSCPPPVGVVNAPCYVIPIVYTIGEWLLLNDQVVHHSGPHPQHPALPNNTGETGAIRSMFYSTAPAGEGGAVHAVRRILHRDITALVRSTYGAVVTENAAAAANPPVGWCLRLRLFVLVRLWCVFVCGFSFSTPASPTFLLRLWERPPMRARMHLIVTAGLRPRAGRLRRSPRPPTR